MFTAPRVVAAAAVSIVLFGCAPSGDDPASRLTTWEASDGDYRIRYLDPPWELVDEGVDFSFFRIQSNANLVGRLDGGPGKYELRVTTQRGDVPALMEAEVRAAISSGATIREGPRTASTLDGARGQELLTFELTLPIERHRRIVLFSLGSGRVLRLGFEATPDLDTPQVDAMIDQVGVGPLP